MQRSKTLDRALSRAGACSRTAAVEAIRAGRVRVDGAVVRDPARWVAPSARLSLDGRRVEAARKVVIALHKPRGYVTTARDPEGRRTVYDLLGDAPSWVGPVGRLDRDTSGLLLLTNDTELADRIASPTSLLPKVYRARVRPALEADALEALRRGVALEDGPTRPALVRRLGGGDGRVRLEITITEGRNRQVRRMVRAVGGKVEGLKRVRIGPIELGALKSGEWRALGAREVAALRAEVVRRARSGPGRA